MTTPSLLALVSGIFTPLATVIDKMHTSADKRAAAQAEISRLHNEALKLAIDVEKQQLAVSARLIAAEAGGGLGCNEIGAPSPCSAFLDWSSPIVAVC